MMDNRAYWVWLQHAFGAGSEKPASIARRFSSIEQFHNGGVKLWSSMQFISDKDIASLLEFSVDKAIAQLEFCEKLEQKAICYDDEEYPEKLRQIHAPPAVLYVRGEMPDFDNTVTVSVVGSRDADINAIRETEYICSELAKEGVIIVSGGALGIDTAGHKGALAGFGTTACILACSVDYPYLMRNQLLRNKIVEKGGCLISEYPVNTSVQKGTFVIRNRIMSGLCNGLLVARAKKKSGTMLTVAHAVRQNKDIFALPGDINDPLCEGTNLLIQDGATPVLRPQDILDNYINFANDKVKLAIKKEEKIERKSTQGLSTKAKLVYNVLEKDPMHISQITEITGLSAPQVMASMTELELLGYGKTYSGQRYSLV